MVFQAGLIYGLLIGIFAAIEKAYSRDPRLYVPSQQTTDNRA
jgi:hypothetical protein